MSSTLEQKILIQHENRWLDPDVEHIYITTIREVDRVIGGLIFGQVVLLSETIENVIKQYGVRMICIGNLMTAMETVTENSNLYLAQSNFVGSLKKIAVRHNVVVILVEHPRKTNGDFTNDDVAGSGDITNKVDVIMSYQRCDDSDDTYDGKLSITKKRLLGKYASGENAIGLLYSEKTKRITSLYGGVRKYGWELDEEMKEALSLPF